MQPGGEKKKVLRHVILHTRAVMWMALLQQPLPGQHSWDGRRPLHGAGGQKEAQL